MSAPDLVERLAAHRTLGSAPRTELEWLAAKGTLRHLATGELLSTKGAPVEGMFVILDGHVALFVERGGSRQKAIEWKAGDVGGVLPYSRMVRPPGDSFVQEPTTLLVIHRDQLREMIRECYEVTAIVVHIMIDRARTFTSSDLHNEKMISLGKLSAGLAHELNNPAAAIERGAVLLESRLDEAEQAARALGAARLSDGQLQALDEVRSSCVAMKTRGVRSPIEEAEREQVLVDWLADHGLDETMAEILTETAVTLEALDEVAAAVEGPALEAVLRWAGSGCAVRGLASDIQEAALRISGLVVAVKGFTHMDQAPVADLVDLGLGLGNTVTVLSAKARGKSASVVVDVPNDLPPVLGYMGELNQIWSNLIDNALDALAEGGRVEVTARHEGSDVVVRVIDNGSGIPDDVRARIFDPFFTTKAVGEGTGLGLDIVRRLIRHNDGDIEVESVPGRTEFRVRLPIAADAATRAQ